MPIMVGENTFMKCTLELGLEKGISGLNGAYI
jgi:hypothetical protein